jgi:hypothetical protein
MMKVSLILIPILLVTATVWACASSQHVGDGFIGDNDGGIDAGALDASPDVFLACTSRCSADLRDVLTCDGKPIKTCSENMVCAPDRGCVSVCTINTSDKSAIGCDYYAFAPPIVPQPPVKRSCYVAFLVNTSDKPVNIAVEYGTQKLDTTRFAYVPQGSGRSVSYKPLAGPLPVGEVALLALSREDGDNTCPQGISTAVTGGDLQAPSGIGATFHITTNGPVVAYDLSPFGGSDSAIASATLLLPTAVWGTDYVVSTLHSDAIGEDAWMSVVAAQDDTEVTLRARASYPGEGAIAGGAAFVPVTYKLQAGQFLKLSQTPRSGASGDLSGSLVTANKPIGLWGGNPDAFLSIPGIGLPYDGGYADGMHQQLPPVSALGREYVAVRYRNRVDGYEESPPWRFVGAADGTVLDYDPPVPGAPTKLARGEVAEFNAAGPFVVRAQDDSHPFYLSAHMTGCCTLPAAADSDGGTGTCSGMQSTVGCAGDPESVNVIASLQFLAKYVFFTDPTYPETNLVFVRRKAADGTFKDVTLDCAGALSGWQPIGSGGKYEYARVDLVRGNFEKQGACENGRREAQSAEPFGLTVWAWGSKATGSDFPTEFNSYAYPAGAAVNVINPITIPR